MNQSAPLAPCTHGALETYQALLARLEEFTARVLARYPGLLRCGPGCADCCQRDLTLYPFEVDCLVAAVRALPEQVRHGVQERATRACSLADSPCPLLDDDRCLTYAARPVICRTHGFPLLVPEVAAEQSSTTAALSLCPHNFKGVVRITGPCVLDLGPVNQILAVVNTLESRRLSRSPERRGVARALVEELGPLPSPEDRMDRGGPT